MYTDDGPMFDPDEGGSRVSMSIGGVIAGIVGFILYAMAMSAIAWIVYSTILGIKAQL